MKKVNLAILGIAVLGIGAIFAFAQMGDGSGKHADGKKRWEKDGMHKMHRGGKGMGINLRGLDLTDAQMEQVKAIREASKPAMEPLRQAMKKNRLKFREAKQNGADEATLTSIKNEMAPIREQMKAQHEADKSQIMAILTDEQKAKLAEREAKRAERRAARKAAGEAKPQE
ncbi:MAG: Spy/CpxP family protein refolding chaperone [Acidobacteria bacterium]|nr:Spy/CpxP family protein refolding chaperone [Acidobacteriota bacterium]